MGRDISEDTVRFVRIRRQRLEPSDGQEGASVAEVIREVGGLQAQSSEAAALGVRVRSHGLTLVDVARARFEERSIVRTWCMRGTLHLVAAGDLPCLLSALGRLNVERGRRRLAALGLSQQDCDRSIAVIRDALAAQGPLTRGDVARELLKAGIAIAPRSQASFHLVRRACLLGIACEVAPIHGKEAYALLDDWLALDATVDRDAALAELAHRYISAYQPASARDFAAWSGLPMADVRKAWKAISDELAEVQAGGQTSSILKSDAGDLGIVPDAGDRVRLLPAFDTYLLGYRDRHLSVAAEHAPLVTPGGGILRPTVIAGGKVIGTWALHRSSGPGSAEVKPFEPLEPYAEPQLRAEIGDVGRFLGRELVPSFPSAGDGPAEPGDHG